MSFQLYTIECDFSYDDDSGWISLWVHDNSFWKATGVGHSRSWDSSPSLLSLPRKIESLFSFFLSPFCFCFNAFNLQLINTQTRVQKRMEMLQNALSARVKVEQTRAKPAPKIQTAIASSTSLSATLAAGAQQALNQQYNSKKIIINFHSTGVWML